MLDIPSYISSKEILLHLLSDLYAQLNEIKWIFGWPLWTLGHDRPGP
jgi:hypothetical protein